MTYNQEDKIQFKMTDKKTLLVILEAWLKQEIISAEPEIKWDVELQAESRGMQVAFERCRKKLREVIG